MANVTPEIGWNDVYRIEDTDYADGGEDGLSNRQAKQLQGNVLFVRQLLAGALPGVDGGAIGDIASLQLALATIETDVGTNISDITALQNQRGSYKVGAEAGGSSLNLDFAAVGSFFLLQSDNLVVTILSSFLDLSGGHATVMAGTQTGCKLVKPIGINMDSYTGVWDEGTGAEGTLSAIHLAAGDKVEVYVGAVPNLVHVHITAQK